MTDKTPLDNLNQSIANFEIADFNCEYSRAQIMKEDALVYIKHTEARIKELENALRQAKYTANVFEESSIRDAKVKNEFADKVRSYQTVVKEMQGRINELEVENSELEAQVTALKKLDDDNNADSVRRLKQMEEDKRTIKELQAKLKAWEKEAEDAQGN